MINRMEAIMSTASSRSAQRADQWRERITRQERGGVLPGARPGLAKVLLVAQPASQARVQRNLGPGRGVPLPRPGRHACRNTGRWIAVDSPRSPWRHHPNHGEKLMFFPEQLVRVFL